MAKDHKGATAVAEAPEAEKPKVKEGDANATTTVDTPAKEKKARTSAVKDSTKFRILDGVDAAKFNGQRKCVVLALQKLAGNTSPETFHPIADVVSNTEGLVARVPVADSVRWHLKGLADAGVAVRFDEPKAEVKKEEKPAA